MNDTFGTADNSRTVVQDSPGIVRAEALLDAMRMVQDVAELANASGAAACVRIAEKLQAEVQRLGQESSKLLAPVSENVN